ncbi:MAG: M23 family metallopeptidase [bacterium]|nr:M23 family metallopeptidase [bacterium]
MAKKKSQIFTFVLIRETEHPIRQVRLKAWQLRMVLGSVGGIFVVLLALSALGLARSTDMLQLQRLTEENQRLHRDIRIVEDKAGGVEAVLQEIDQVQRWARNFTGLEAMERDITAGGVGGPAPVQLSTEVAGLDTRLERLSGQAMILRTSAQDVLQAVRDDKEALSRIPSIRPIMGGRISSRYGRRVDPFTGRPSMHHGLDFAARRGTPIYASANGRVKKVRRSNSGYGNEVVLDHGNGFQTRYAHCDLIMVSKGQKVARGEIIATVGNTGRSTGPHLHYEVIESKDSHNPSRYILSKEFIVD